VHSAERRTLGAQVAAAPDVVAVTADAVDPATRNVNLQAAHGFTQWACVKVAAVLAGAGKVPGELDGHPLTVRLNRYGP
jgi:hypothetical protein